jgi:hypothetical protein
MNDPFSSDHDDAVAISSLRPESKSTRDHQARSTGASVDLAHMRLTTRQSRLALWDNVWHNHAWAGSRVDHDTTPAITAIRYNPGPELRRISSGKREVLRAKQRVVA